MSPTFREQRRAPASLCGGEKGKRFPRIQVLGAGRQSRDWGSQAHGPGQRCSV